MKGTGRLYLGGYEVQPVHSTRRGGKKRYTKKEIDVIAAHVQPLDTWYLIPIEAVGRAKSLRLYPESVGGEGPAVQRAEGKMLRKGAGAESLIGSGGGMHGRCWTRNRS